MVRVTLPDGTAVVVMFRHLIHGKPRRLRRTTSCMIFKAPEGGKMKISEAKLLTEYSAEGTAHDPKRLGRIVACGRALKYGMHLSKSDRIPILRLVGGGK